MPCSGAFLSSAMAAVTVGWQQPQSRAIRPSSCPAAELHGCARFRILHFLT